MLESASHADVDTDALADIMAMTKQATTREREEPLKNLFRPIEGLRELAQERLVPAAAVGARNAASGLRKLGMGNAKLADQVTAALEREPQILGKFAGVLESAYVRGPGALAATIYSLKQSNPEFREIAGEGVE